MYKNLSFELWPDLSTFTMLRNKSEARDFFSLFGTFTTALTKSATKASHTSLGGIMKGLKIAVVNFHYAFWHIYYLRSEFYYAKKTSFDFQTLINVVVTFANTKVVSGQCD